MSIKIDRRNIFRFSILNCFSIVSIIILYVLLYSCQDSSKKQQIEFRHSEPKKIIDKPQEIKTTKKQITVTEKPKEPKKYKKGDLVLLKELSSDFFYDIRYSSENNTFKERLYECDACLLRYEVALAIQKANERFKEHGYRIKFFDCYRPLSVSKRMWEIIPNPSYVKNPSKGPSMHNRGVAVDLTLVDQTGKELNMGTDFDFFGKKAHHAYTNLPPHVLKNRKLLKSIMQECGFRPIRTEWWHYSYKRAYPALDIPLPCGQKQLAE